jgi:hypothetical protein
MSLWLRSVMTWLGCTTSLQHAHLRTYSTDSYVPSEGDLKQVTMWQNYPNLKTNILLPSPHTPIRTPIYLSNPFRAASCQVFRTFSWTHVTEYANFTAGNAICIGGSVRWTYLLELGAPWDTCTPRLDHFRRGIGTRNQRLHILKS